MADDVPNEEKLDELEEHIQKARTDADEAIAGFDAKPKEAFVDSGSEDKDEDDQTIAPG
jgi:hypothetical protein